MRLHSLDHVNVRTADLAGMIAWYGDVLDMHPGPRPPFSIGGAWLYAAGKPIVHLVETAAVPRSIEPKIEHFAIGATGLPTFVARLTERGVAYSLDPVPGLPVVQVNITDCDGNHIHIDFPADEAEGVS